MSTREEIIQQALSLPVEDRAYVADAIEQSLGRGDFATPEIAAAWMAEIERRALAYERGETTAEDWRTVISRLRARPSATSER
jgi:putative addiction module component (TIGR02574 family)